MAAHTLLRHSRIHDPTHRPFKCTLGCVEHYFEQREYLNLHAQFIHRQPPAAKPATVKQEPLDDESSPQPPPEVDASAGRAGDRSASVADKMQTSGKQPSPPSSNYDLGDGAHKQ